MGKGVFHPIIATLAKSLFVKPRLSGKKDNMESFTHC